MMIKLKDLLTEGKITSDVERAAKKLGINFKKKVKTISTNKYSNPTGGYTINTFGNSLINALGGKYVQMKPLKYSNGGGMVFRKNRKDPKTEFTIVYTRSMSGPYISYEGVKGQ